MSKSVVGTIFQVNPDAILFEFVEGEEETVGVVRPALLRLGPTGRALTSAELKSLAQIQKHMSPGDEVACKVAANSESTQVVCQEDEEEIGRNGEVRVISRTIEITPEWIAFEGYLVEAKKTSGGGHEVDEIGDILEMASEAEGTKKPPPPPSISTRAKPRDPPKSGSSPKKTKMGAKAALPECLTQELTRVKAKVVQLKKPAKCFSTKTKVSSLYVVLSEGQFQGQKCLVQNNSFYIWGHCMREADFLYNLRGGDEVTAEVYAVPGPGDQTVVKAKSCYIGPVKCEPVPIMEDLEFATWLGGRSLDYEAFTRWVNGKLMLKNFFPLASPVEEGELVEIAKVEHHSRGHGGLLALSSKQNAGKYAFFTRRDFYIHCVNIGHADIFRFLKVGDKVKCQLEEITSSEKRKFKKFLKSNQDIHYVAYVAFIGDVRPKSATLLPHESLTLKDFLKELDLTPKEFQKMRIEPLPEVETPSNSRWDSHGGANVTTTVPPDPYGSVDTLAAGYPSSFPSAYYPPMGASLVNQKIMVANALTTKALMIPNPKDPVPMDLLQTELDLEVAFHLAKVLTTALTQHMHGALTANILKGITPEELSQDLQDQTLKLGALDKQLHPPASALVPESSTHPPMNMLQTIQSQLDPVKARLDKKFEELEKKGKEESIKKVEEAKKIELMKKKEVSVSKMRKMLNQFKKTVKEADNSKSDESKLKNDPDEKSMSPLELLRFYTVRDKTIVCKDDLVHFGEITFPRSCKTNYRVARTSGPDREFYTLHALIVFMEYRKKSFSSYEKEAKIKDVTMVRSSDSKHLTNYLTGEQRKTDNIVDLSYEELNKQSDPEITILDPPQSESRDPKVRPKSRTSSERSRRPSSSTTPMASEYGSVPKSNPRAKRERVPRPHGSEYGSQARSGSLGTDSGVPKEVTRRKDRSRSPVRGTRSPLKGARSRSPRKPNKPWPRPINPDPRPPQANPPRSLYDPTLPTEPSPPSSPSRRGDRSRMAQGSLPPSYLSQNEGRTWPNAGQEPQAPPEVPNFRDSQQSWSPPRTRMKPRVVAPWEQPQLGLQQGSAQWEEERERALKEGGPRIEVSNPRSNPDKDEPWSSRPAPNSWNSAWSNQEPTSAKPERSPWQESSYPAKKDPWSGTSTTRSAAFEADASSHLRNNAFQGFASSFSFTDQSPRAPEPKASNFLGNGIGAQPRMNFDISVQEPGFGEFENGRDPSFVNPRGGSGRIEGGLAVRDPGGFVGQEEKRGPRWDAMSRGQFQDGGMETEDQRGYPTNPSKTREGERRGASNVPMNWN